MKNQLTSLELSKELDSLAVRVESAFVWRNWYVNDETDRTIGTDYFLVPKDSGMMSITGDPKDDIPAYSVAELGKIELRHYDLPYWHEGNGWQIPMLEKEGVYHRCDNEACARAKMLIYLIKNNLLDVTKLKA